MSQITDLIIERVQAKNSRKGKLVRKPTRPASTRRLENQYKNELYKRVKLLRNLTVKQLSPLLKEVKHEVKIIRKDQDADEIASRLEVIKSEYSQQFPDNSTEFLAAQTAAATSTFNLAQEKKVFTSMLGATPVFPDNATPQQLRFFIKNNVSLIKSIPTEYFDKVETAIYRNFSQGGRAAKTINEIIPLINQDIRKELKKAKNRAKLISLDQIQKLNGQLSQLRQTEIGLSEYRWRTMQDERVRPEHEAREGDVFKWNNPPSGGHPGEAINCRCYAEPVIKTSGLKIAA